MGITTVNLKYNAKYRKNLAKTNTSQNNAVYCTVIHTQVVKNKKYRQEGAAPI